MIPASRASRARGTERRVSRQARTSPVSASTRSHPVFLPGPRWSRTKTRAPAVRSSPARPEYGIWQQVLSPRILTSPRKRFGRERKVAG